MKRNNLTIFRFLFHFFSAAFCVRHNLGIRTNQNPRYYTPVAPVQVTTTSNKKCLDFPSSIFRRRRTATAIGAIIRLRFDWLRFGR
uniref:Putative secreted protein n=1 Tax=Anopheles darlingi TaxID=43151 RepID=A0A2M4DM68_ANODA